MKKYINYILLICMVFLLTGNVTAAQDNDPLDRYLEIAARNNPDVQSLFIQYHAALERLPQAGALPDPTVMFNIFISPVETRVGAQRAGISLSQAFPWFGQLSAQESAAAERARARYEMFQDARNKLFFEVRSTYYDVYVLNSAIDITERNIEILNSFRELANIKLESGKGSSVDLLRVEMELSELENQLKLLNDSRNPLYARFSELLNSDTLTTVVTPDTLQVLEVENRKEILLDSIYMNNPSLKRIDHEIASLDNEIDVAHKMGLPSFNLGLSYTYITPRSDMDVPDNGKDVLIFPQVGVRIPLYRNKYKAMVREKEYLREAKTEQREAREDRLNTELEKVWKDIVDADRRVKLYLHLIDLANQSLDILVTQYTTAGKDFEEMLRMDRQLLRYELELEKARADQNSYKAYINYLTGKQL